MTSKDTPPAAAFAGKFKLIRLLGRGAMGEVWLAVEEGPRNFRRQVALKRLLATGDLSDYARESFVAEAQVIARLDHPNIVRLIELGETEEDHSLYLVLDFVDGAALDRLVKKGGPLSPVAVAYLGREVAKALSAVHSMADENGNNYGVVHRDVSPANILISRDGRVRLSDFGVARISGFGGEKTETGVFKGKLPYMPPEQASGHAFDGRADCFSLGVTIFESLLGGRLRRAETQGQLIAMIATEQAPRVRDRIPDAPEHLAYAIDYATVFHPEQRVGSAAELAQLLDDAMRAIDPRGEAMAVAELRDRVSMIEGGSQSGQRAPWSVALGSTGQNPDSGTGPHLPRPSTFGLPPPPNDPPGQEGSGRFGTGSGPHPHNGPLPASGPPSHAGPLSHAGTLAAAIRATPPSVPSGAYTAAGTMGDRLDGFAHPPNKKRLAATIALGAGVMLLGVGAIVLFVAKKSPPPDVASTGASGSPLAAPHSAEPAITAKPVVTSAAPVVSAEPVPTESPSGAPATPRTTGPLRPRPTPSAGSTADAESDTSPGTLQVIVVPWGNVSVDGKSYGTTPIAPVSLAPGPHTVSVNNPDLGAQRSQTVRIAAGKPSAVKFDLKKSD